MRNRLREALARRWGRLWRMLGPSAMREMNEESTRWAEARARFWAELREGQREAESASSTSTPSATRSAGLTRSG